MKGMFALQFSGVNTYGGVTTIPMGSTLEILNSDSFPHHGAVTNNGALIFNHATGTVTPTVIVGSGSVTVQGDGTLALLSPNGYSGGTTLTAGTVQVSNHSSLGTGPVSIGCILEFLPAFHDTLTNPIILTASDATIQTDPGSYVLYYGSITGTGPLTKTGTGTFALFAANNFTGGTIVSGGNLLVIGGSLSGPTTVDSGALFGGFGSVGDVVSNGTVAPLGPLQVSGNYQQNAGAAFDTEIGGNGRRTFLAATGTASLDGTVNVVADPGAYAKGTQYTILSAAGGVTPSFSTVNLPSFVKMSLVYEPDAVVLEVTDQSILVLSNVHHHNPKQVLNYLQEIIHIPNSDLINVVDAMGPLDNNELTKALDQLHPAIFGAFDLLNANTSSMVASIFDRHMGEICCMHLKQNCGCKNASLWVQPFGYFYDQDQIGEQVGFNAKSLGVLTGVNYCFSNGILIGAGGGYSSTEIHWDKHRGHGSVDTGYFGIYSDYSSEPLYLEASLIGSVDSFHASRFINYTTVHRHARHGKGGYDFTAHIGGGGDIKLSHYYLKPFATVDYLYLYQEGFHEHGAGDLNLAVKSRHSNMLRSELGLSLTRSFHLGKNGCWSPTIWLSGINEAYLRIRHYHSRFEKQPFGFEVRTFNKPIYLISPGIDLSCMLDSGFSFSLRYSAELNGQISNQKVDGRAEWFF
ncbi:MAG: autotransporter domain-containing protein [Verrucomicrobia bacterium]|nr:autotransporter domain-containing protein [Verrucomicrobiota bacterium]